jgi:8-amino-3,8-dideoxy-alpha-D-manno-octulosonate transaminase
MPGYELMGKEELAEIQDVFTNGGVLFRHGFEGLRNNCFKVLKFEKDFGIYVDSKYSLAVTSGTAAIRVALASLEIGIGDEVIAPCFTFVATVEGIIEAGATPICAEIDKTLNLDPEDLIRRITPKTRAVIVVHMLGTPARLVEILEICRKHNLILIEDTAWGCGGNLNGKFLGTWGDLGTYSFDFAKTMTTGEGGMIVFQNEKVWKKAIAWHDHGHENNSNVPRWEDTRSGSGFNYRMMELQGAIGIAQLKKLPAIVKAQRENKRHIWQKISNLDGVELRDSPEGSYETADALVLFVLNGDLALNCRRSLLDEGISTKILPEAFTWHFASTWNHMPELVKSHHYKLSDAFPRSHALLSRAISIPVSVNMSKDTPDRIYRALKKSLNCE